MACASNQLDLQDKVTEFWNSEPCGFRYLSADGFAAHAAARYLLEPHIPAFADFNSARGLKVLEVGVGMGADYERWLRAGACATGVDLSAASLELARARCQLAGLESDLHLGNAQALPFPANSFDIVYSYGVMHHSPDPAKCLQEAFRVAKPGGEVRVMLYHHPSVTGIMLWLRYGLWRGQTLRRSVYEYLESPGTQTFSKREVRALMSGFEKIRIEQVYSPGDLLLHEPSRRYRDWYHRFLWKVFPRAFVRMLCGRWGLFLLIKANKPLADTIR